MPDTTRNNDNRPVQRRRVGDGSNNMFVAVGDVNSNRLRTYGNATSTDDGDSSALKIFERFLAASPNWEASTLQGAFASITSIAEGEDRSDAQGEEIVTLLMDYGDHLIGEVPAFKPPHQNLKVGTKGNYFGKVKQMFLAKFSDLKIWEDHDSGTSTGWYSQLRSAVEKKGFRHIFQNSDDDGAPTHTCRALVVRSSEHKVIQENRIWLQMDGSDLESIVRKLLVSRDSHKYEHRAMLVMLYFAAGRGGEAKFINWGSVTWDYHFSCTQVWWTRMKTTVKQLLMFQCYRDGWLCDFYHAFGCYFSMGGLIRGEHMNTTSKNKVFPSLYQRSDKSIAGKITDMLKKYCDGNLKPLTSIRSLRVGAITELKVNTHLSETEAGYATGFATKDNSGIYVRPPPSLGMASANHLCSWPSPKRHDVMPPSLESLSSMSDISNEDLQINLERLLTRMFPSSVDDLKPSGRLAEFTKTCFASMLMNYNAMNESIGRNNAISNKLVKEFKSVFKAPSDNIAQQIVIRYGRIIKDKFEFVNHQHIVLANAGINHEHMTHLRSQSAMLGNTHSKIMDVMTDNQQLRLKVSSIESMLHRRTDHATQSQQVVDQQAQTTRPRETQTQARPRPSATVEQAEADNPFRNNAVGQLSSRSASQSTSGITNRSTGTKELASVLQFLISNKQFLKNGTEELVNEWWRINLPPFVNSTEAGCFRSAMKLVYLATGDDDKEYIRLMCVKAENNDDDDDNAEVQLITRLTVIVKNANKMMTDWDKIKGRKKTIQGLGKRARDYFQTMPGREIDPEINLLMQHNEVTAVGVATDGNAGDTGDHNGAPDSNNDGVVLFLGGDEREQQNEDGGRARTLLVEQPAAASPTSGIGRFFHMPGRRRNR